MESGQKEGQEPLPPQDLFPAALCSPARALAPQPLETQPSSIEQTGLAELEFSSSTAALTSKITVCCSLIVAGPEELEGRPWAPLPSPADSGARAPRAAPGPSC